jgi:hypothetical protein
MAFSPLLSVPYAEPLVIYVNASSEQEARDTMPE